MKPLDSNPAAIIDRLREMAAAYIEAADLIESILPYEIDWSSARKSEPLTLEAIRSILRVKGARAKDIADEFGVPLRDVQVLIGGESSGIIVGSRGWLQLVEPETNPTQEQPAKNPFELVSTPEAIKDEIISQMREGIGMMPTNSATDPQPDHAQGK